ncbi:hypothetical protein [Priestia megaterium]|uniref:hypothetical protein n=1 Tax=Priestia megaterium TaxID=1404 RepID=UPI000BFBBF26|nr:hypothetical protein [Priestia megaterium]PGO60680.1 hypothetical protein CN981_09015 [Priestia megaterium]
MITFKNFTLDELKAEIKKVNEGRKQHLQMYKKDMDNLKEILKNVKAEQKEAEIKEKHLFDDRIQSLKKRLNLIKCNHDNYKGGCPKIDILPVYIEFDGNKFVIDYKLVNQFVKKLKGFSINFSYKKEIIFNDTYERIVMNYTKDSIKGKVELLPVHFYDTTLENLKCIPTIEI